MKIETYLKYRKVFEQRCKDLKQEHDLGYVNLYDVKKGIRNFPIFLHIYYQDKKPSVSNIVSSIDRRKRFFVGLSISDRKPALKINIWTGHGSLVDIMVKYGTVGFHQYSMLLVAIQKFG